MTDVVRDPLPTASAEATAAVDTELAALPGPLAVFARACHVLWSDLRARVGLIILGVFVLMAAFAPWITPHDPHNNSFPRSQGATGNHWFGTTGAGEDTLSQLIYSARVSVGVGLAAGAVVVVISVVIGMLAGYLHGWRSDLVGFFVNLFLVVPSLPLMIIITTYLPGKGPSLIILVIGVTGWAWGARVLRAQTATLRNRDFVQLATFSGERSGRIIFREILPNMTSLVAASFVGAATAAIAAEAGLEFLGLGDPSTISWGTMLYWAQNNNALLTGQWALLVTPGLFIALFATSLSLVNFGMDAISNPRLRESEK